MKTQSINWPVTQSRQTSSNRHRTPVQTINRASHSGIRFFLASVPALAVVVGFTWAAAWPESARMAQALTWAMSFVFLALSVEYNGKMFYSLVATGLALPVLALISRAAGAEFLFPAAMVMAAWLFAWIYNPALFSGPTYRAGGSNITSMVNIKRSSSGE